MPRRACARCRCSKAAGYPEAAVPIAPVILDPFDEMQLEAIAAELNIFLADKVMPRRRVGLLVEVRKPYCGGADFCRRPVGDRRDPRAGGGGDRAGHGFARSERPRRGRGALCVRRRWPEKSRAADRPAVLAQSGPILAATIGATDPMLRLAAIRVIGRVFARRPGDPPIDETVGDAVIMALNDRETVDSSRRRCGRSAPCTTSARFRD